MYCRLVPAIVLFFLCSFVQGYSWGNESMACYNPMPMLDEDATMISDNMYYRISPNMMTFYPGQKLYIRIKGKTSDDRYTYTGALLTVRAISAEGEWHEFHPNKYRRIACNGIMNTGIVESNNWPKIVGDDVFIWTAPESCDFDNPFYKLTGTVVMNSKKYLSGLNTSLRCIKKPIDPVPMPTIKDACLEGYSEVPNNGTSFEMNYGGWWNDPMAALRWTRHTGPTASPRTGPKKAIDGDWYIYSEASYPAKKGDMAILNSPLGLAGCFCVRLKCHMFSGPGVIFYFKKNGEIGFTHSKSFDNWIRAYETVNIPGDVQVQMVMIRGDDFRGDIAVDDLSITPGMCEEDKM